MSTKRGYLTDSQYQSITGNDGLGVTATATIEKAEAIIDGYIGFHSKARPELSGTVKAATTTTVTLSNELTGVDYLKGCTIEFLSGNLAGTLTVIQGNTADNIITVVEALDAAPALNDMYRIYQVGKYPETLANTVISDVTHYAPLIPQALREAVAYQVEYMQELGDATFSGRAGLVDSERIDNYSYSLGDNAKGGRILIAPKARQALAGSGIINRTGSITY